MTGVSGVVMHSVDPIGQFDLGVTDRAGVGAVHADRKGTLFRKVRPMDAAQPWNCTDVRVPFCHCTDRPPGE